MLTFKYIFSSPCLKMHGFWGKLKLCRTACVCECFRERDVAQQVAEQWMYFFSSEQVTLWQGKKRGTVNSSRKKAMEIFKRETSWGKAESRLLAEKRINARRCSSRITNHHHLALCIASCYYVCHRKRDRGSIQRRKKN